MSTVLLIISLYNGNVYYIFASLLGFLIAFLEEKTDLLMVRVISTTMLGIIFAICLLLSYLKISSMHLDYKDRQREERLEQEFNAAIDSLSLEQLKTLKTILKDLEDSEPGLQD